MDLPNLSGTDRIVLGLLADQGWGEMYGREMVDKCEKLTRGSIYVLLKRMEDDKGLVESRRADDGSYKRLYRATGTGQFAFNEYRRTTRAWAELSGSPLPDFPGLAGT